MLATLKRFAVLATGMVTEAKVLMRDDFDHFNMTRWKHEITMGGGGNWEFEYYTNNRTNSFVKDGVLHLQPTLTADTVGEDTVRHGSMDLWGGAPASLCTSN